MDLDDNLQFNSRKSKLQLSPPIRKETGDIGDLDMQGKLTTKNTDIPKLTGVKALGVSDSADILNSFISLDIPRQSRSLCIRAIETEVEYNQGCIESFKEHGFY